MVSDLGDMLQSRLRLWQDPRHGKHTSPPAREKILVYRDGISEGPAVLSEEMPLLRRDLPGHVLAGRTRRMGS